MIRRLGTASEHSSAECPDIWTDSPFPPRSKAHIILNPRPVRLNGILLMRNSARALVILFLALALVGCYPSPRRDLLHPGPHFYQRGNAARHDPFPDNNAGPEVVGARPREFMNPLAEPRRNQPFEQQPRRNVFP